ncbi:MAG: T9SS type A sorting domain-containing protein, partial [Bacteroidales bacterium]|nr:T9SS type A sorting domain-containing protein [Bacteroidales bacterium]
DNDGDLDIISYSSLAIGYNYVSIYLIQNGKIDEELKLDFVKNISGDKPLYFHNYDKSNSVDFVYTYKDVFNYICCNRDNWGEFSRKPRRIRKLFSNQDGFDVILKWPKISGTEGFSYNLMVGTSSNNADIVAPESGLISGNRFVGKPGNASFDTAWKLSDLPTGNYFWKIQVIDNSYQGGSWSELGFFTVSSSAPDFTFNEACLGDTTYFTNLTVSSDTILEWKWWYKGSVVSNEENPKVVFKDVGTFNVRLEVITSSGSHVDKTHVVTVKRRPTAEYTLEPVCFGNASVLAPVIDTSNYVIDSWLWDLGNNETSTVQDTVINTYITNTPTKLTIIDTNGCGDSVSNVAIVTTMPAPEITFKNGFVVNTCDNDSVILTTQYDTNFTYRWIASLVNASTGGQAVAGDSNVLAVINYTPDLYRLKVTVTNELGKCTITSDSIEIEVRKSPAKPLIEAKDVTSICELDTVPIEVISGEVDNYVWYLDESELNNPSPLLIAREHGEYRATVVDTNGCDSDKSDSVMVEVTPIPFIGDVFVDGPTEFCEGESVTLGFTEAEAGATYRWKRNNVIIFATNRNTVDARHKGIYHMEATFDNFKCFRKSENVEVDVLVYPAKPLLDVDSSWINMCHDEKITLKPKIIQPYSYQWYRNGYLFDSTDSPVLDSILPEGSYTVICSNFDCSTESDSVFINRKTEVLKPICESFGPNVWYIGCLNNTAKEYKWYFNGTLLSDETDHICMVNQRFGSYQLAIDDGTGCWNYSDTMVISANSETSDNNKMSFEIFPNPNNGQFSLKLSSKLITDNTLRIYSRSGLLVKQILLKEQSHTEDSPIDVTGLPTGVYHLELTSKQNRYIKKLIIE